MEYCTPNELAEQYGKSLKTIYNRLQKYADKIRTKKEFGKTIVNCNDFERLFQNYKINYKKVTKPKVQFAEKQLDKEEKSLGNDFVKLQNDYNITLQRIQNLEKHNSTLSTQLKEYALLFTEEKKEKQLIQTKLEDMTQRFTDKVEYYSLERIRLERKYYILFAFFLIAGAIIFWLQFNDIIKALAMFMSYK